MTPYRSPYPVPGVVWASLPLPALLIGPDGRIAEVNPAGEIFLNASSRTLMGQPAFDRLSIDAPMDEALLRARANQSPLFINDVDVTTGYGPEIYASAAPPKGVYHVYVNYYGSGSGQEDLTTAQVAIVTQEGTVSEKRQVVQVPLRKPGELTLIKSFSYP